jgi:hypothetical protein
VHLLRGYIPLCAVESAIAAMLPQHQCNHATRPTPLQLILDVYDVRISRGVHVHCVRFQVLTLLLLCDQAP